MSESNTPSLPQSPNPILYQSPDQNFILLDLPQSIASAQLLHKQSSPPQTSLPSRRLFSCRPLEEPYPSTEPKSEAARANVLARLSPEARARDDEYRVLIRHGLEEIRKEYSGPWLVQRVHGDVVRSEGGRKRKRKRDKNGDPEANRPEAKMLRNCENDAGLELQLPDAAQVRSLPSRSRNGNRPGAEVDGNSSYETGDLSKQKLGTTVSAEHPSSQDDSDTLSTGISEATLADVMSLSARRSSMGCDAPALPPLRLSSQPGATNDVSNFGSLANRITHNSALHTNAVLTVKDPHTPTDVPGRLSNSRDAQILPSACFYIPPHSAFSLNHLQGCMLSETLTALAADSITSSSSARKFDLLLLDPPWPNRSVRRSKHYSTSEAQEEDAFSKIVGPLTPLIAEDGIVAIWITHRESIREQALVAFQEWDVDLAEEWVWAKITAHGELVHEIDGLWRKGWEVLLVGRRRKRSGDEAHANEEQNGIKREEAPRRRLICAVPDVHSRKPCLKVFEQWMGLKEGEARALEVFARNLVAGWCSIGDEVLRFQWERWWKEDRGGDDTQGESKS